MSQIVWKVTGDTHADFSRFYLLNKMAEEENCHYNVIILGDMGVNFWLGERDKVLKKRIVANYPHLTFYGVRGNHEARPRSVEGMALTYDEAVEGFVYSQKDYPSIKYFQDGCCYKINGYLTLVLGGAYSVDKDYRLAKKAQGLYGGWFEDEQLSPEERERIFHHMKDRTYDLILSHTCPISWEPRDLFLSFIDQSKVDKSMEIWMDQLRQNIEYRVWLFGHFHDDRVCAHGAQMLYHTIQDLDEIMEYWK